MPRTFTCHHCGKFFPCNPRIKKQIYQPHVRPIPRGKIKSQIEFGAKLGVSLDDGFARINTFSWDAYHEAGDLIKRIRPSNYVFLN